MRKRSNWLVIAWAPFSRRSETFARQLDAKLYCVHIKGCQRPFYAPARYILYAVHTLQILFHERPRAVHVQNPPFACGLVVYLYCRLAGAQYVLDHHSAAFGPVWSWALPIQRAVARHAATNIVTNQHWASIVQSWNAHALIMGDPFLPLPQGEPFPVKPGLNVAFISTFSSDEPIDTVVQAAAELPEVHFYITGDAKRRRSSFTDRLPANVTCTGFLPDAQYVGLLRAVDAIMVLTTRDHTLQLGGCEAVSIGQPLITSDWPFLQSFFARGAVYVSNTITGIRSGILAMKQEHARLKAEMLEFRSAKKQEWNSQFAQLCARVSSLGAHYREEKG